MPEPTQQAAPVTNSGFLRALAGSAANGTTLWVAGFRGSPDLTDAGNWAGRPYNAAVMAAAVDGWAAHNAYFSVAALRPGADGELRRRKANFARLLALVADDVFIEDIRGSVTYVLATSPGKHQVGIFIDGADPDAADLDLVGRVVTTMADRGMLRADASGNNAVRYVRLPVGENQKPRDSGAFAVRVDRWAPQVCLSLADAAAAFGVDLDELRDNAPKADSSSSLIVTAGQDERLRLLTASILRGEDLHDSINKIAASLVATAMPGGAVVNMLRALMEASHAAKDERWLARYQDIPRAVSTAEEKFRKEIVEHGPDKDLGPRLGAGLVMTVSELDAKAGALTWAVKHLVPERGLGFIFGASGTFKSFIALDYALHRCYGMRWLGRKTKQATAIYLAAEGGAGLIRRIKAWHMDRGMDWQDCQMRVVVVPLSLRTDAHQLRAAVEATGVSCGDLIVDTMSQTFSGNENSNDEVAEFLRVLGTALRDGLGCAVTVVHHTGHIATERPRGASAIIANIDFAFGVFRDEKEMLATVEFVKIKDEDRPQPVSFDLRRVEVGHDEDGDPITSLAASQLSENGLSEAMKREALQGRGGRHRLFLRLAQNGMAEKELRKVFGDESDIADAEARRKAYYRSRSWAIENGFIEIAEGFVIVLKEFE